MSDAAEIFNHRYEDDDYTVDNFSSKIVPWILLPPSSSSSIDDSGPHDGAGAVDRTFAVPMWFMWPRTREKVSPKGWTHKNYLSVGEI